ncbi:hypothetical protein ACVI1L_000479 [Bradyrhizobium sp. USDA 4516]
MDAFDHFWQWAEKPLDSPLTIPRSSIDRRDRAKVNQAAARAVSHQ